MQHLQGRSVTDVIWDVKDPMRVSTVVLDDGQAISVDAVVFCTGSDTATLIERMFGVFLPIYPVKGYSITVPVADAEYARHAPSRVVVDAERHYYATLYPTHNGVAHDRLGAEIRFAAFGEVTSRERANETASDLSQRLTAYAKTMLPRAGDYARASVWSGKRPWCADDLPVISGLASATNAFVCAGHGPLGWSLACGSAAIIGALVDGADPQQISDAIGIDMRRFSADRFRWFS